MKDTILDRGGSVYDQQGHSGSLHEVSFEVTATHTGFSFPAQGSFSLQA